MGLFCESLLTFIGLFCKSLLTFIGLFCESLLTFIGLFCRDFLTYVSYLSAATVAKDYFSKVENRDEKANLPLQV